MTPLDGRLYPVEVAPVALAAWVLGVALGGEGWWQGCAAVAGWLLGSTVWWQLFRRMVLQARAPSRLRFHLAASSALLGLAVLIGAGSLAVGS